jgi:signal transduction histidine kinase/CheY-like chemotaxis protein
VGFEISADDSAAQAALAATALVEERRHERVLSNQVAHLIDYARERIAGSAVFALVLWVAYFSASGNKMALVWALVMHVTQAAHFAVAWRFHRAGREALIHAKAWLAAYLFTLTLSALCWGSAAFVVLPDLELPSTASLVLALLALAGAGAYAVAAVRAAIGLWLLPVLLPLIGWMAAQPGPLPLATAALGFAFLMMSWFFADRQHQLMMKALHAELDNNALVHALRQQVVLVEQANREKSRFLASASHDLRQPMHALGLFASALEKQLKGTPQQPVVTNMIRAIDALEQSFSAMLDISKLDAGVIEPNMQSFPIRDLFRVLHMHCAGQAEERGLSLRFKPGGKIVTSDPQLLERVIANLVHNAIRYTQEGGIVVVVRSRQGRDSIEVWDTGIGIPPDELPKVFDEFYQVTNPGRDRSRGLGMGLAIVKRLVLLMGHSLEVQSRPGRGTMFRILLKPTEMAEMETMVLGADTVPSPIEEDRTVLVIDDEESIRSGMAELLKSWGYKPLVAGTIAEACAEVRRHAGVIDLVVSDLRLANQEDGLDAVEQVRKAYGAPLPAVMMTGDTSPDRVKRVHESGHQVLFKPVRSRDLHAALRSIP